jgi:prepilin peptidase CpaA
VTETQLTLDVLSVGLVLVAAVWDFRTRRIPNRLTMTAALLGLALQVGFNSLAGAQHAAIGWLVGLAVLLLPCLLGWVGGGDIKLLAALGALQGPHLALMAGLYGIVAGGLLSAAILVARSRALAVAGDTSQTAHKTTLAYGPALALGALLALALR